MESSSGRKQSQFLVLFVMPKARSLSKFSLTVSMVGVSVRFSIKVKSTPRPVVLTIESILDGAIVTRINVACANVSVTVVPCSYFRELNLCAKFPIHSTIPSLKNYVVVLFVVVIFKSKVNS